MTYQNGSQSGWSTPSGVWGSQPDSGTLEIGHDQALSVPQTYLIVVEGTVTPQTTQPRGADANDTVRRWGQYTIVSGSIGGGFDTYSFSGPIRVFEISDSRLSATLDGQPVSPADVVQPKEPPSGTNGGQNGNGGGNGDGTNGGQNGNGTNGGQDGRTFPVGQSEIVIALAVSVFIIAVMSMRSGQSS